MITLKDLKIAINSLISSNFTAEVTSRDIREGFKRPSFFVELDNIKKSPAGEDQINRELTVRIYYFPSSRYQYNVEILEVQEKLEEVFDTKLKVQDRYFNIDEVESIVTDGVLQFYFDIRYEEGREVSDAELAELMENLYIKEV
ncbi:phage tail terminator family protein [Caloranaerobacter sp. DY30410]|uniref:phage tail terminator family protein n=1 Tax=Caloranaerobacter sp. DY30410 TaxID=3238305 RepID=UPI003D003152